VIVKITAVRIRQGEDIRVSRDFTEAEVTAANRIIKRLLTRPHESRAGDQCYPTVF
jgi:hypothetical protein